MHYKPIRDNGLKHNIIVQIISGPAYNFVLNGSARKPRVEPSFLTYDFGPCFVLR